MKKILTSVFILACCMGGVRASTIYAQYCDYAGNCKQRQLCHLFEEGWSPTDCSSVEYADTCWNDINTCTGCKNSTISCKNFTISGKTSWDSGQSSTEGNCYFGCKCNKSYNAKCNAGTYGTTTCNNAVCGTCESYTANCQDCPQNSTSPAGTTTVDGCKCNADYYKSGSSCVSCESARPNSFTNNKTGSTSIDACVCEQRYYMKNNKCESCPEHTYTSKIGSTSINDCKCEQGYYMDNGACKRCPVIQNTDGTDSNTYTTTKSYGATSIQECFIQKDIEFCDETGCGTYTDEAYHN